MSKTTLNRRSLLRNSVWGAGAAMASGAAAAATNGVARPDSTPTWIIDETSAVADTESGKVYGYIRNGIRVFKGIPYGEITPEGRWMRAAKPRPWTGKRSALAAGYICPSAPGGNGGSDETWFRGSGSTLEHAGEDCLRINVWTPGLDNKKRNVLFWCHGGGFNNGSSLMSAFYDFANFAQYGDLVVVSMNHRLNALGFLDLTAYGARYTESANVGMLDVIDALKWVRTNVANFGGDPAKVMIAGHSGGGAKVLTLTAMPEAKGLFNRAAVHSPGPLPLAKPDEAAARTAAFLKLLDVSPSGLDALHKLPVEKLTAAAGVIINTSNDAREKYAAMYTSANNVWRPVIDGKTLLFEPTEPAVAPDVPMLIGTALHEMYSAIGHAEYDDWSERQARDVTAGYFGPIGEQVYNTYKAAFPHANPFEISAMARATGRMRLYTVKTAQNRAAQNGAPTYLYWFQWYAKILNGRFKSHHELEIPLVFQHSDDSPQFTGASADARALGVKMSDAWLSFARTGNPGTKALPSWKPVTPKDQTAMVFDSQCRIDNGSDAAAIELIWKQRHSM
jgi:para-nitrobenzyl esterase